MYRLLSDLRILRLALHMEETFERYEESLRSLIAQVPVRARLAPLFAEGEAHHRLRQAYADLSRQASRLQETADPQDILQTLRECEKGAQEFYMYYLDRLSNPALIELFKSLAEEEAGHGRAVESALELLKDRPRAPSVPSATA